MKKYFAKPLAFTFLTIFAIGSSCNGQAKKDSPKEKASESKIITYVQPKLIKTQGSQPGDNVHCSLQDKAGNLWFGTTGEGLYRYDGRSFSQFTVSNGLNSNTVQCILEDKDGKIWIGTEVGLCFYDGEIFSTIQIPLRKGLPPNKYFSTHCVYSIMQDKSGKLWFATIDGVYVYDGKSFTAFIVNEGATGFRSSNNNVEYILEDKAGNIWLGGRTNNGVFRYDGKTITNFKIDDQKSFNIDDQVNFNWAWPVLQDKKGNIWFSNWYGAYRYDGKSFKKFTKNDGLSSNVVVRIIEDKKGNLWFGCDHGGICRYDGKTFTCLSIEDGLLNNEVWSILKDRAGNNDVWSILEDRAGNLWVGTRNTGLYRYDGKSFTNFSDDRATKTN